jgi:putative redox protein
MHDTVAMQPRTPPLTAELVWSESLRFDATSGAVHVVVDGDSIAGPSPVQLVAIGLAGCMAIDLLEILRRGRHPIAGLRASLTAERAPAPPRRFTAVRLHFEVSGDVPAAAVERAVTLSRETYCSVWHSLRQDIELAVDAEIHR